MQHSTARRMKVMKVATKRPTPKASTPPRSPGRRPARAEALREEAARIQRDIAELTSDFESRITPLTKAYAAAIIKLEKIQPTPKPKRRRSREQASDKFYTSIKA